jgi:hypothetical protein
MSVAEISFLKFNPPLTDVLQMARVVDRTGASEKHLFEYLAARTGALINLALSEAPESVTALQCLCQTAPDHPLVVQSLASSAFTDRCSAILVDPDPNPLLLNRVAALAIGAFTANPREAITHIRFLDLLLPHVDLATILSLFEKLLSGKFTCPGFNAWIADCHFADLITLHIASIDFSRTILIPQSYDDVELERLLGYYTLVSTAASNSDIAISFRTTSLMSQLSKTFGKMPPTLGGARWKALRAICVPSTVNEMVPLAESVLKLMSEPRRSIDQEVVEAIRFLTRATRFSRHISKLVVDSQYFRLLLGSVLRFDNASFLHAAFREFLVEAVENPALNTKAASFFLPFLIAEARGKSNGMLSIWAWKILEVFSERGMAVQGLKQFLRENEEFRSFVANELKGFREMMSAAWGGSMPLKIHFPSALRLNPDTID